MAIVLTVHLVESIWQRNKQSGLRAPYLVVDHNGQQQQTASVPAATVTAWNQKASFPYVPTSDLVIMAFDAGYHSGSCVGQASVDVAAMLGEGSLSGHAPLISSSGDTLGIVSFDVALSTSSRALAAGLDIPGLTLSPQALMSSNDLSRTRLTTSTRQATLQEDHLSVSGGAFALPGLQRQQTMQQQASMQQSNTAVDKEAPEVPSRLTQKLAKGAHGLGNMLGLGHLMRKSCDEAGIAAYTAAAAAAAPPAPAAMIAAASADVVLGLDRFDSSPESAGPLPGQLLAKRNSLYLRSSGSFSSPSAPPLPPGVSAGGPASGAALLGGAMWDVAAAGTTTATTGGIVSAFAAAARQHRRYSSRTSRSSDCSSIGRLYSEVAAAEAHAAFRRSSCVSHSSSVDRPEQAAPPTGATLSPLRSSRTKLRLSPSKVAMLAAQRHQQQVERQQQLQEQHMLLLEAEALREQQAGLAAERTGTWDEDTQQKYDAAGPAEKEAILYKQLMLQQAEKQAGAAQLLNILAVQQQQEAARNTQLLAALAALSPGSSPRHLLRAFASSTEEEDSPRRQPLAAGQAFSPLSYQQQQQQQHHDGMESLAHVHELRAAAAAALMRVPHSPVSTCTPELGSPDISQRPSHTSSVAPPPIMVGPRCSSNSSGSTAFAAAGVQRLAVSNSSGSSITSRGVSHASSSSGRYPSMCGGSMGRSSTATGSDSSSSARDSSASGSSKSRYYPEVTAAAVIAEEKPTRSKRKQWAVTRAAPGDAESRDSGSGSSMHSSLAMWHSCEDGAPSTAASVPGSSDAEATCDRIKLQRPADTAVAAVLDTATAAGSVSPKRKSRFHDGTKQTAGGLGQARSEHSAASMPSSPLRLAPRSPTRSAAAESHYSEDSEQPAYSCTQPVSGDGEGGYCYVRNEQVADTERWCMHEMLDAVPYAPPPPCFPFQAVSIGPSAPPA